MCTSGIPKQVFDNGSHFLLELFGSCRIDHVKSSSYYPHRNGQAKATNKALLRILSRMVYEEPKKWGDFSLSRSLGILQRRPGLSLLFMGLRLSPR